jgi:hypothetical protein
MNWADRLQECLDEWGKAAFAHELEIDFSRARIFDGKWARISFDTLRQFSKDDLRTLGNILTVSNLELRKSFPDRERQLLGDFEEKFKQQVLNRREQMIEEATSTLREPLAKEWAEIRRNAPAIFKKVARRIEFEIKKEEPSGWMLSRLERWGEIRMPFDLLEPMEFSYYITIEDNDYRRVVERDSYLQRLGISSSTCQLTSAEIFADKMEKVAEIIEWQVNEYIRIIQPLDWPKIEPFS